MSDQATIDLLVFIMLPFFAFGYYRFARWAIFRR